MKLWSGLAAGDSRQWLPVLVATSFLAWCSGFWLEDNTVLVVTVSTGVLYVWGGVLAANVVRQISYEYRTVYMKYRMAIDMATFASWLGVAVLALWLYRHRRWQQRQALEAARRSEAARVREMTQEW